jgi:hypothetical protein
MSPHHYKRDYTKHLSVLGLDVLEDDVQGWGLLSEVSDDSNRAADSLADTHVSVELGKANPFTDLLARVSHDQVDTTLSTKGLDELLVLSIVAVIGEDAKTGSTTIQSLGAPSDS